jgi:integrase
VLERSAWGIHGALTQLLACAVRVKLLDENIAARVPSPEPRRRLVSTFEAVTDLEAIAGELPAGFAAIPVFAALTGLRCEEWIALERCDIDRRAGVVHVRRVHTDGTLRQYARQARSLRAVPLPLRALQALHDAPARLDTPLVFPAEHGGFIELDGWRRIHWKPAVAAAGLEERGPDALRHTYASFSIAAGVALFELSRWMGTSVEQIGRTYGHLLPDATERTRTALDVFVATG